MIDDSTPVRDVTDSERADYDRDGAVVLRGILQPTWIERMRRAVDRVAATPGDASVEYSQGKTGRYLGDFFVWMRDKDFRAFALASPLRHIAAQMMGSQSVTFFYDQLLVKEPLTPEETPWHQDLPYWPLRGADILSLWVAFDAVLPEAGAMRYVRASHKAGVMYAPRAFSKNSGYEAIYAAMDLPPFPDLGDVARRDDVLVCPVEPGDIIVHHPLTFHWSPGNASATARRRALALRYIGDDAVYDARPGTFVENSKIKAVLKEPIAYRDGDRIGGANFPRVL
jgi:ectoine hydroxylase-related dioxygenase (phytanoyl-CoA dioxygenase family)